MNFSNFSFSKNQEGLIGTNIKFKKKFWLLGNTQKLQGSAILEEKWKDLETDILKQVSIKIDELIKFRTDLPEIFFKGKIVKLNDVFNIKTKEADIDFLFKLERGDVNSKDLSLDIGIAPIAIKRIGSIEFVDVVTEEKEKLSRTERRELDRKEKQKKKASQKISY